MRTLLVRIALLLAMAGMVACRATPAPVTTPAVSGEPLSLPSPALSGELSLEETLARRRSVRDFDDRPLTPTELGQLLWAAQGLTDERGYRTAPSAGALYPLELYVATQQGVFHYQPQGHGLVTVQTGDVRSALYGAALHQAAVREAPAIFVIAAVYERTAGKYGAERAVRYVHLEAGHAAQNVLLQAVALGLGSVPIGAFDDGSVQQVLGLPADHLPLYLIPVGHPRGASQ